MVAWRTCHLRFPARRAPLTQPAQGNLLPCSLAAVAVNDEWERHSKIGTPFVYTHAQAPRQALSRYCMTFTRRWRPRNHVGHLRRHGNAARKFPRWPEKETRGDREDGGNFLEGGVRGCRSFESSRCFARRHRRHLLHCAGGRYGCNLVSIGAGSP